MCLGQKAIFHIEGTSPFLYLFDIMSHTSIDNALLLDPRLWCVIWQQRRPYFYTMYICFNSLSHRVDPVIVPTCEEWCGRNWSWCTSIIYLKAYESLIIHHRIYVWHSRNLVSHLGDELPALSRLIIKVLVDVKSHINSLVGEIGPYMWFYGALTATSLFHLEWWWIYG